MQAHLWIYEANAMFWCQKLVTNAKGNMYIPSYALYLKEGFPWIQFCEQSQRYHFYRLEMM